MFFCPVGKSFCAGDINLWWSSPSPSPFPPVGLLAPSLCRGPLLHLSAKPFSWRWNTDVIHLIKCSRLHLQIHQSLPLPKEEAWQPVFLVAWRCKCQCPPFHFFPQEHERDCSACRVCSSKSVSLLKLESINDGCDSANRWDGWYWRELRVWQ